MGGLNPMRTPYMTHTTWVIYYDRAYGKFLNSLCMVLAKD